MPRPHHRGNHYDTDGFSESQQEEITACDTCGGALRIDSVSDRGVHIPRKVGPRCRETGHGWYDDASAWRFDQVFLQDRPGDNYHVKKK